jgi:hypothetical protein
MSELKPIVNESKDLIHFPDIRGYSVSLKLLDDRFRTTFPTDLDLSTGWLNVRNLLSAPRQSDRAMLGSKIDNRVESLPSYLADKIFSNEAVYDEQLNLIIPMSGFLPTDLNFTLVNLNRDRFIWQESSKPTTATKIEVTMSTFNPDALEAVFFAGNLAICGAATNIVNNLRPYLEAYNSN